MAPQEKAHVSQSNVRFLDHRSNVCSWSSPGVPSFQLATTLRSSAYWNECPLSGVQFDFLQDRTRCSGVRRATHIASADSPFVASANMPSIWSRSLNSLPWLPFRPPWLHLKDRPPQLTWGILPGQALTS